MSAQRTSLYDEHVKLSAKIVDFAGWEMPIQYKNLKAEVEAVRSNVGVFDVSHMGEFFIEGNEALKFTDFLVTNDIANAELGKAIYSPLCREDGTIIDDLIVYKISENYIMICVNASNIDKDFDWIESQIEGFDCTLKNRSHEFSLLAVQGPNTVKALKSIDLGCELKDIDYYSLQVEKLDMQEIIFARTGYTGEDGFEIFGPHKYIQNLWSQLVSIGAEPCGLGSRDVLRLEVGYPLYGNELNDEVTPLDSGLKWTVKMSKTDFIGKKALMDYKPNFRLVKLSLDKGIPREGYQVENEAGTILGQVTSGSMSVVLKKGIAIARIKKDLYDAENQFFIDIRGKKYKAELNKKPFVAGGHK